MELEQRTKRCNELRIKTLDLSLETGLSHLAGSFSMIELLTTLYDSILREEDKFILSKGHACLPYYLLLREKGYKPRLSGHPEIDPANGIYCTTGSLGHGLPIGVGMSMARQFKNQQGRIYVMMSDGECQEGTTWESSLIASKYKLRNLTAIVDDNKIQATDFVENILPLGDLRKKFEAFGWYVAEINGHDFNEIDDALAQLPTQPYMIIANTVKGKGVSYIENNPEWHAKKPKPERLAEAYKELRGERK